MSEISFQKQSTLLFISLILKLKKIYDKLHITGKRYESKTQTTNIKYTN